MDHQTLYDILKQYELHPNHIETVTEKVFKIYTTKGTYALKRIQKKDQTNLINGLSQLVQSSYKSYIPIYSTYDHQWFVNGTKESYYLMPWIQHEKRQDLEDLPLQFIHEIAQLHNRTKKEWNIDEKDFENYYEMVKSKWQKEEKELEAFIERCEKKWYMSPFELQAVTYYTEMRNAIYFAKEKWTEWYENMKEQPVARIVLVHGNASTSHLLIDERGERYLTNFERSHFASPIKDLIAFYNQLLTSQPFQCEKCVEWLKVYDQNFSLTKAEKNMLQSYLAYPTPMMKLIQQYERKQKEKIELMYCRKLLKRYWLMKNIEYVMMKWSEADKESEEENKTPSSSI